MGDRGSTQVKNKAPAPMQITAEQILREARERQEDENYTAPAQKITDPEELAIYRLKERKHFEDRLRMNRNAIGTWLKYAAFEEAQRDFERARSVYERAIDIDHRNTTLWLKYAECEMRNRHINAARNVWDRAVTLMPRVDQFWFKYIYMEEMLGNITGARAIFNRWVEWEPDDHAWSSFVRLELRAMQPDRARGVFERWVECHNLPRVWIKWAKFEEKQSQTALARAVFEKAMQELDERDHTAELFLAFVQFEERAKEFERCRVLYRYALDTLPKSQSADVYQKYVQFEKQHGDRRGIEHVVASKKRFQYEEAVKKDPYLYDSWFDYLRLEEDVCGSDGEPSEIARVREVYERAIANVPPAQDKRLWRRYIFLWLRYAIFEELAAKDPERARLVLAECRKLVPHSKFTFAKLWVHSAHFEVRQGQLTSARKLLGNAIGRCPKEKLFREYIQLELQLGEIPRCRKLYERYLEWSPEKCTTWIAFAELEASLGELDRCRAIFELAIGQPQLDMPEQLWKAFIDFEIEQGELERTRDLYRNLLGRTTHPKVWMSFAKFEAEHGSADSAAAVFAEADGHFRGTGQKEERALVLDAWYEMEHASGDADRLAVVNARMPKRIKRKRPVQSEDGVNVGYEDYYEFSFPEDQQEKGSLKILEAARAWKKQKAAP